MSKKLSCLLLSGILFVAASTSLAFEGNGFDPQSPLSPVVIVPDGTPVRLSLEDALNSSTSQTGESIHFRVLEDVRVGNFVVIASGSPAVGHIVNDEHKKMLGRGGKLEFTIDYIKPNNGNQVRVRANAKKEGKDSTGKVIAFTVLISPLFLMLHGKDVVVPRDTTVTAYVDGEQDISMAAPSTPVLAPSIVAVAQSPQKSSDLPGADPPPVAQSGGNETLSALNLKSQPPGAEISIDGEFVGDTPSSIRLNPGHHTIVATKVGFKNWQRTLTVSSGGNLSIDIVLEKVH
jgi:hypothetical protein